jgi:hypothetical protein
MTERDYSDETLLPQHVLLSYSMTSPSQLTCTTRLLHVRLGDRDPVRANGHHMHALHNFSFLARRCRGNQQSSTLIAVPCFCCTPWHRQWRPSRFSARVPSLVRRYAFPAGYTISAGSRCLIRMILHKSRSRSWPLMVTRKGRACPCMAARLSWSRTSGRRV